MTYVAAIVLAAGKGLRFRSDVPKPLVKIRGKPAIVYCLNTLSRHPGIKEIILVVNPLNSAGIASKVRKYRIRKIKRLVFGGRRRQDSVANGLKHLNPETDLVLIHDADRPFIDRDTVLAVIKGAQEYGAAVVAVPVKATIKKVNRKNIVDETLSRDCLWEIQTPQAFKKDLILKAFKKYKNTPVTDDAQLVERLGAKVKVVMGSYSNIKITTPEDLVIAEAIARSLK